MIQINNIFTVSLMATLILTTSCQKVETTAAEAQSERIDYYNVQRGVAESLPFQYRNTYYHTSGEPVRWTVTNAAGDTMTDYQYIYSAEGTLTGGRYKEPGDRTYALEKISLTNDSTQLTEWLDSTGQVYYTMIDNLNASGKTYRATFIGDTIHGYDSTFYTSDGFESRIFFTNTKGVVMNDRSFRYDSIAPNGAWIRRYKIRADTVQEMQVRSFINSN